MKVRWLGWAGVEVEHDGERIVVDPLADPAAVFAWRGSEAPSVPVPEVTAPRPGAQAGLVTHLHRDHADAEALRAAVGDGGVVFEPARPDAGTEIDRLAGALADGELAAAGFERRPLAPWTTVTVGSFSVTALPAVDGVGDPQVSWHIAAGGASLVHLGDTMFHGWWWRIVSRFGSPDAVCAPINGSRLTFPHRRPASPLPAVMDPEQAALAAELLGAGRLVPIHYGGYATPGLYEPAPDALARLLAASPRAIRLDVGESVML